MRLKVLRASWLSECLNLPCFILGEQGDDELYDTIQENYHVFISCKLPENALKFQTQIEAIGFEQINLQLTFEWEPGSVTHAPLQVNYCFSSSKKLKTSLAKFAEFFVNDRFNLDTRLPKNWAIQIKNRWVTEPDGDRPVLLAKVGSIIIGFVMFKRMGSLIIIDLIAVDPVHRGQKIGLQLLSYLQATLKKHQTLIVGTQAENRIAQKLYYSAGFRHIQTKKVYHFYREKV